MRKVNNILGVDWGTKYIGMAYSQNGTDIILPIGNMMNDGNLFFNVGDILERYNIKKVVIGWPKKEKEIQKKIDEFIKNVLYITGPDMEVIKQDEDYTSVEAGAVTGNFKKNESTDTIAAMKILERYLVTQE